VRDRDGCGTGLAIGGLLGLDLAVGAREILQGNPVLRSLRTGQARLHGAQIEFQHVGE
jgi:hypothetical protein